MTHLTLLFLATLLLLSVLILLPYVRFGRPPGPSPGPGASREGFESSAADPVKGEVAPSVLNDAGQLMIRDRIDSRNRATQFCVQAGVQTPAVIRPTPSESVCTIDLRSQYVRNQCTSDNGFFRVGRGAVKDVNIDAVHNRCNIVFEDDPVPQEVKLLSKNFVDETPGLAFVVLQGSLSLFTRQRRSRHRGNNGKDDVIADAEISSGIATNLGDISSATGGSGGGDLSSISVSSSSGGAGRAVEWAGFFHTSVSGHYVFYMGSYETSMMWLGTDAKEARYTRHNALIRPPRKQFRGEFRERRARVKLDGDVRYDIRIQYEDSGVNTRKFHFGFVPPDRSTRMYDGREFYYRQQSSYVDRGGEVNLDEADGLLMEVYEQGYFEGGDPDFFSSSRKNNSGPSRRGVTYDFSDVESSMGGTITTASAFSVQWRGFLEAKTTGRLTLKMSSAKIGRLWLGGSALLDRATTDNALIESGGTNTGSGSNVTVSLVKGRRYPMLIRYGWTPTDDDGSFDGRSPPVFSLAMRRPGGGRWSTDFKGATFPTPGRATVEWGRVPVAGLEFEVYTDSYYEGRVDFFQDRRRPVPAATGRVVDFGSVDKATDGNTHKDRKGVSAQWIGAFVPPTSGTYLMHLAGGGVTRLWLGLTATAGHFSSANALITSDKMNRVEAPVYLRADRSYPMRLQWGNHDGAGGDLHFAFQHMATNKARVSSSDSAFVSNLEVEDMFRGTVDRLQRQFVVEVAVRLREGDVQPMLAPGQLKRPNYFCSKNFAPSGEGMAALYADFDRGLPDSTPLGHFYMFRPGASVKYHFTAHLAGTHDIKFWTFAPTTSRGSSSSTISLSLRGGKPDPWKVTGGKGQTRLWKRLYLKARERMEFTLYGGNDPVALGGVEITNTMPVYEVDLGTLESGKPRDVVDLDDVWMREGRDRDFVYIRSDGGRAAPSVPKSLEGHPILESGDHRKARRSTLCVPRRTVTFYEHPNWKGRHLDVFTPTDGSDVVKVSFADMKAYAGNMNDVISSWVVHSPCTVVMFRHPKFVAKAVVSTKSERNIRRGWHDAISALHVYSRRMSLDEISKVHGPDMVKRCTAVYDPGASAVVHTCYR